MTKYAWNVRSAKVKQTIELIQKTRVFSTTLISSSTTTKFDNDSKHDVVSWSFGLQGHAQKCFEHYCEGAHTTAEQFYKVSLCLDDHQFQKEEYEMVVELSGVCSQMVLQCLYLADRTFMDCTQ